MPARSVLDLVRALLRTRRALLADVDRGVGADRVLVRSDLSGTFQLYELASGEVHVFQAKAIIFATGGFGKIYKTTSNAHTLTGDGVGIIWVVNFQRDGRKVQVIANAAGNVLRVGAPLGS